MHNPRLISVCALALLVASAASAQTTAEHGKQYERLLIKNVHVIDGNGTPISGPTSVLVENDRIARIGGPVRDVDAVIDGEGRYLIPGLINLHGHLQDGRAGVAMPFQFQMNLWLASGITTIRDVGCDRQKGLALREQSLANEIPAPRIYLYFWCGAETPEEAVKVVDGVKELGGDGIKLGGMDREPLMALLRRASELELPVAHHIGVEETDVRDDIVGGTRTIEHWYGIPDAAIPYGSQSFPADYNYSNELDRFRWAGRLWKDADPERLSQVLQAMVDAGVAWDPTLTIYVASRDMTRAQNQPWFEDYLHPALEKFFEPSLDSHGSYFLGWTTEDEIEWKRNYNLWFAALREFAERGGVIGTGEDAGFIYQIYGFGYVRELELQQEAGFHPLDVLKHATGNGAKILGLEHEIGRVKAGYKADLALVNGNPLGNFKLLYPNGTGVFEDGEYRIGGRVAWTIKDGVCYDTDVLLDDAKRIVREARAERDGAGATEGQGAGADAEAEAEAADAEADEADAAARVAYVANHESTAGARKSLLADLADFGPFAGTTDEEWRDIRNLIETFEDPSTGTDGVDAGVALVEYGRKAWPAILNEMKALDLATPAGERLGDRYQRHLMWTANGRTAGWRYGTAPDDVLFNEKVVLLLSKVWKRASTDEAYWRSFAKLR